MTKRIGNIVFLEKEPPQQCDHCGNIEELRPYGKGGACVCFDCMMLDEGEAQKRFGKTLGET